MGACSRNMFMNTRRALAGSLGVFGLILLLAGCGGSGGNEAVTAEAPQGAAEPAVPRTSAEAPQGAAEPAVPRTSTSPAFADSERRAVYDKAAEVLQDGSLSYSERRNRLRLVRRGFGDDLFFVVVEEVPVYDAATGRTVTFADYMSDLAGTFVGHPQAPITFDPVGAATQIYFSPTEDTVRRMTGIGITDERVAEHSAQYRAEKAEREQVREGAPAVEAPPPAFVSRDPELNAAYKRARKIYTDDNETEASRREKIRVLQEEVGHEKMSLVLRYVPIIDLEKGTVRTFDDYIRGVASSYDSGAGSPLERDPVGAGMRLLFDPSPDTFAAMTGIGLSGEERHAISERYEQERVDEGNVINRIVADTFSQFNWGEVHQATEDANSGIISIWGSKRR